MYSSVWNLVISCQVAGFVTCEYEPEIQARDWDWESYTHIQLPVHIVVDNKIVHHAHPMGLHRILSLSCLLAAQSNCRERLPAYW